MTAIIEPKAPSDPKSKMDKMQNLPIVMVGNRKISDKEEKHLREMGEYEFMNTEEPGLMQKFTYGNTRNKHTFTFMHGGKYTIPRFIARYVESRSTPIWKWVPDGSGSMHKQMAGTVSRFQMREVY